MYLLRRDHTFCPTTQVRFSPALRSRSVDVGGGLMPRGTPLVSVLKPAPCNYSLDV